MRYSINLKNDKGYQYPLSFLFVFICLIKVLFSQGNLKNTNLKEAKGIYLSEILAIKDLNIGTPFTSGQFENCFTIKNDFLYVADYNLELTEKHLSTITFFKVDLKNSNKIIKKTLNIEHLKQANFLDIKVVDEQNIILLSRYGILRVKWVGEDLKISSWYKIKNSKFLPTSFEIINDSLLSLSSTIGGLYQEYSLGKITPSAIAVFNINQNILYNFTVVKIPGIYFTRYNNHRFLTTVDSFAIYSNGLNYSLFLDNILQNKRLDSIQKKINDPYWIEVEPEYIKILNSMSKFMHGKIIRKAFDSLSFRVSNINGIHQIEGMPNSFLVFREYGSRMLTQREFEKGLMDVYTISKSGKMSLINSEIFFPKNTRLIDTVDHKHHKVEAYGEACFSNNYAILYQTEVDDEEIKQMLLKEKGNNTLQEYYDLRKKKLEEEKKPFKNFFYIYKYF